MVEPSGDSDSITHLSAVLNLDDFQFSYFDMDLQEGRKINDFIDLS